MSDFDPLLALTEVIERTSLSEATIYRKMRKHEFPLPIRLSGNIVRWKQSELSGWIDNCPRVHYVKTAEKSPEHARG